VSRETGTARKASLFVVSLIGVCIFIVGAIAIWAPPGDDGRWIEGQVPELGAAFDHPASWHVQYVEESIGNAGMIAGVVSNIDRDLHHPDQGPGAATSAWDLSDLLPEAVVISIEHVEVLPFPSGPDDRFPVSLSHAIPLGPTQFSGGTQAMWLEFTLSGRHMGARVYFGAESSVEDQRIASRIVASIHPV
jgi:hypothetical protein